MIIHQKRNKINTVCEKKYKNSQTRQFLPALAHLRPAAFLRIFATKKPS